MSKRSRRRKKAKDAVARLTAVDAWIAAGLGCLTFAIFVRSLWFPFINFDDPAYVFERPQISRGLSIDGMLWAFTHVHSGNWHPLTSISHMLDCQFFGLNAGAHHFVNVVLHTANAVLLFLFLTKTTAARWSSAFVAAVFAIHPLRVESVAWIAERKDVLSGLLFILTLLAYVRYIDNRITRHYLLVTILFACGLMAKPMLVTTPFVLLLLDYWPLRRSKDEGGTLNLLIEKLPLFALSGASAVATMIAQKEAISGVAQISLPIRFINAIVSYSIYIWKMVWPVHLGLLYPYRNVSVFEVVGAILVLGGLTTIVFALRKRAPYLVTGWLWYVIMLLPVIGIVSVGRQAYADRYTYLPQIGLYMAIGWGVKQLTASWRQRSVILAPCCASILIVLALLSSKQLSYWQDPELLWQHTIAVTRNNDVAHAFLSDLLMRKNQVEESLAHAQEAVRIKPSSPDAQNNLALALFRSGRMKEAAEHWEQCLQIAPHDLNAESNYGWLLATCPDSSLRNGARAVELTKDVLDRGGRENPMVLRAHGAALAEAGKFNEAISVAEEALHLASQQHNEALAGDLSLNIANYRANRPLRDPGKF